MVSGSTTQIREVLNPKDFQKKCLEHETFLLHLLVEDSLKKFPVELHSYFTDLEEYDKVYRAVFTMPIWLNHINLPYYELLMKDAADIMIDLGYTTEWIYHHEKQDFWRAMLIIHKGKVYFNTQYNCYCSESVNDAIAQLNPNFFKLD
jgi:hypothetical protein